MTIEESLQKLKDDWKIPQIEPLITATEIMRRALYYYQGRPFCTLCKSEESDGYQANEALDAAAKVLEGNEQGTKEKDNF